MKKLFFVSAAALLSVAAMSAPVLTQTPTQLVVVQDKKVEIKAEELPQAVKDKIAAEYAEWTISKAYLHEATSQYEVDFKKEAQTKTVKFDKDGNVVN